jgi:hypothetical protein
MKKWWHLFLTTLPFYCLSQSAIRIEPVAIDGSVIAGYVDQGAYLNFSGPGIQLKIKKTKWTLGMLPSLRFKKDNGSTNNSLVTPSLGAGVTFSYKWMALQVPFYYMAKTGTTNGRWLTGVGIGIKLNEFTFQK